MTFKVEVDEVESYIFTRKPFTASNMIKASGKQWHFLDKYFVILELCNIV
jgi:hypothetical protein